MTTLFITHDLRILPSTCQRLILMKQGRIWRQGSTDAMLKRDVLSQLYDVPTTAAGKSYTNSFYL